MLGFSRKLDTTLATVGQIFVRLLKMHGLNAPALLREQGIDPRVTCDAGLRVPAAQWEALMRRAAALIPDPAFGLRAARCWHPSNLGALGHAWLSAETLHAGLDLLVRYWGIIGGRWVPKLAQGDDEVSFVLNDPHQDAVVAPIATDITLAIVLDMCRMNFGASLRPLRIDLLRLRPPHAEMYPTFDGCTGRSTRHARSDRAKPKRELLHAGRAFEEWELSWRR